MSASRTHIDEYPQAGRAGARAALTALTFLLALPACTARTPEVREGDLIFQTSKSTQSLAIQQATHSRYSHMGVILNHNGQPTVFEATATVRYTPLRDWIARGNHSAYVLKRLRSPLSAAQIATLHTIAQSFEGKPYDLTFEWSDERIYCSELVWKLYDQALHIRLGERQRLGDFDLSGAAVRAKMLERYHGRVPLDEPVISPAAMFDSTLLTTVSSASP